MLPRKEGREDQKWQKAGQGRTRRKVSLGESEVQVERGLRWE